MSSAPSTLADRIDALLPQTQCTRCGFPDCRAYAEAIAVGMADIDQCPPGRDEGAAKLAALLGRPAKPVNPQFGAVLAVERVAEVVEEDCIGCTKCIQACPVDAIIGAPNLMHVIIREECTGCELCIPPCPVDCIVMVDAAERAPVATMAEASRARYAARKTRLARWQAEDAAARARKKAYDPFAARKTP
jgi:Na+-translocating ferredoxin:NAD+ oxidoreductase subunit B